MAPHSLLCSKGTKQSYSYISQSLAISHLWGWEVKTAQAFQERFLSWLRAVLEKGPSVNHQQLSTHSTRVTEFWVAILIASITHYVYVLVLVQVNGFQWTKGFQQVHSIVDITEGDRITEIKRSILSNMQGPNTQVRNQ